MAGRCRAIREHIGRPAVPPAPGEAENRLSGQTERIRKWLEEDRLLLTKVHELLVRQGLDVSYSSLYRFARKHCGFGSAAGATVRRIDCQPGELGEVDFGRLSLFQEPGSPRKRVVHALSWCWATAG